MNLTKYFILGFFSAIFNIYPLSCNNHIKIYQDLFNTKIFYEKELISFFNLGIIICILLIYSKDIMLFGKYYIKNSFNKKKNKFYGKYLKCLLLTITINIIIYSLVKINIKSYKGIAYGYVITSLILLFMKSNKGTRKDKDIGYIDSFIIGISSLVIVIPTNSILLGNMLGCLKCKLNKKTSLRYSLTCLLPVLLIDSCSGISYIMSHQEIIWQSLIGLTITILVSFEVYKSLKYMIYTNKLYRLSLYTLLLAIFIFYWFG